MRENCFWWIKHQIWIQINVPGYSHTVNKLRKRGNRREEINLYGSRIWPLRKADVRMEQTLLGMGWEYVSRRWAEAPGGGGVAGTQGPPSLALLTLSWMVQLSRNCPVPRHIGWPCGALTVLSWCSLPPRPPTPLSSAGAREGQVMGVTTQK